MSQNRRKQALGRGLGALLGGTPARVTPELPQSQPESETPSPGELRFIPIGEIQPNPRQPRQAFDPEKLDELANSIREHGILQPVLVSRDGDGTGYILLAGERRVRAAELAGLAEIPARLIEVSEAGLLELALIENVQRDDLSDLEEARGYHALVTSFAYTHDRIAERVGKSRSAVVNAIRLLKLPDACQRDLEEGRLTAGHARAILMLPHALQQELLRAEIIQKDLTVRQAERRAKQIQEGEPSARRKKTSPSEEVNLDVHALQEKLLLRLGCQVRVRARTATSGSIEVSYQSLDDLDRFLQIVGVSLDD
ncbi:ParB/RepB/Spo0J family partition protein [Candidatus Poribacteria bacterium]|nr:ParB/RepB/Spo0J family partition protein [Candidatus Poribacteria bacterium]